MDCTDIVQSERLAVRPTHGCHVFTPESVLNLKTRFHEVLGVDPVHEELCLDYDLSSVEVPISKNCSRVVMKAQVYRDCSFIHRRDSLRFLYDVGNDLTPLWKYGERFI